LLPDQTEDEEDEDQTAPIILVKGPKRSGKSTFARATLNNLLNRYEKVAWLECDLGQGEFSPGGVVGLWMIDAPILGMSLFFYRFADTNAALMIRSTVHSPPRPRESPLPRFIYPPNMLRRIHSRNPKPYKPLHLRTRPSPPLTLRIEQNRKCSTTSDKYPRMGKRSWRRTPQINRDFHLA
jgi:hypothetical protein